MLGPRFGGRGPAGHSLKTHEIEHSTGMSNFFMSFRSCNDYGYLAMVTGVISLELISVAD